MKKNLYFSRTKNILKNTNITNRIATFSLQLQNMRFDSHYVCNVCMLINQNNIS